MDPCPFVRILVGNLALKFPVASKPSFSGVHPSSSPCFCKIKLGNFPSQIATIPLIPRDTHYPEANSLPLAACFSVSKADVEKKLLSKKGAFLKISVYTGRSGSSCGFSSGKLLGIVSVPLDIRAVENRALVVHNGWVAIGGSKSPSAQLFLTVRVEPNPRFVFQFDGEPECSPQVFQIQGNHRQAVFTCKFSCKNSGDRNLRSRSSMSEPSTSRSWLSSIGSDKDSSTKERKGWSVTIHDLSGSPVAAASMVTPFVPSPGSDRVSKSNPGAWLILRPGDNTWKPWGRLEAWRERGGNDGLGYRFELLPDAATATPTTATVANSTVSIKNGGKFTIDMTSSVTPMCSPHSSCDFGSGTRSRSRSNSGSGSGSGSDFGLGIGLWPNLLQRGFVMSSTVEGVGKCSKPVVEVGVKHVTCTEDAAAFVALAAAMDLSMDACRLFSQKLRKELTQQSQDFVV